jgi:site-specific DNA-methyltransferase (adenine-specific)
MENVVNPKDKKHPLEFPVNVYKNLMSRSCAEGDLVIDPFCGSGNSIKAALELGLRMEASEQVEEYRVFAEARGLEATKRRD